MKKIHLLASSIFLINIATAQTNSYPAEENPTIYSYSPLINLQRNTNQGGYVQGIQTRLADGTNNWFFGNLSDRWIISKGDFSSPILSLSPNGELGVGTESAKEKLNVNGNVKLGGFGKGYLIEYASLSETWGGASTIVGNNVMAGSLTNSVKKISSVADPGSFMSLNYLYGITFHTEVQGDLNIDHPVENSEKMRITRNGNVGIGTATPNEKLAVNGNIRAREIKVETSNWPDYVFRDDYQLMPLKEVEQHIQQHGHLPDIPKATQIEEEGLSLGEMNKLMMKKIEELTLHLIEKEKNLESLNKQVIYLRDELNSVRQMIK